MRLGIDFGTTHTVVATGDRGNYPLVSFLDPSGDSHEWFPSLAASRGNEDWLFGFEAQRAAASDPSWTLHRSFKRLLAEADAGAREQAVALCTRYLAALRAAIVGRSNLRVDEGEPLEAVIAAPANAHGTQRFLTMEAFRGAGFDVVAMLNEPSAAGFEYTHRYRNTLSSRRDAIVVYDLGGGTFDVSLIRALGRHHEVAATYGINRLGGDDFDEVLAHLALEAAGREAAALTHAEWTRVCDVARDAKEALTSHTRRMSMDLDFLGGGVGEVIVPVGEFYAAAAPLVEQTILGMSPVLRSADEEGEDSEEDAAARHEGAADMSEVAGIYVVGGASSLPLVGRALRERFGRRVHRSPYPFAATAIGLAIAADVDSGFTLQDMLSRHFGVFREADDGKVVAFDPIFRRDVSLPAPGAPARTLRRVYRAAHNLGHYRFAECSEVDERGVPSGDLTPLGDVRFAFDPALRRPETEDALDAIEVERRTGGPLVQEEYAVDGSGIVLVTISDLENGYERRFRLGGRP